MLFVAVLLSSVVAADALAAGEREINQACASVGCFPGDSPGFPVTISEPGAYRLTSSMLLSTANDTGIRVLSDHVTLDLGGFRIRGTGGTASGFGFIGYGIAGGTAQNVTVRNGMIIRTGSDGIWLGDDARVENVTVDQPRRDGIVVGDRTLVHHSVVTQYADDGISAGEQARIDANVVTGTSSSDIGIIVREGSFVTRNVSTVNGGVGLAVLGNVAPVVYSQNVFRFNNGLDSNPQVFVSTGPAFEISPNVCGSDSVCP